MTAATMPCSRCRAAVDTATAYYSERGDLLCAKCNAAADIAATEERAVGYIQYAAFGNLGVGAFSLIFNPMLIVSIVAVINAVFVTTSLLKDTWYADRMKGAFTAAVTCCILGGLLGVLPVVFVILNLAFGIARLV